MNPYPCTLCGEPRDNWVDFCDACADKEEATAGRWGLIWLDTLTLFALFLMILLVRW